MKIVALSMFLCGTMLMTVAALYAASLSAEFKASQIPLQVRTRDLSIKKSRSSGFSIFINEIKICKTVPGPKCSGTINLDISGQGPVDRGPAQSHRPVIPFDLNLSKKTQTLRSVSSF